VLFKSWPDLSARKGAQREGGADGKRKARCNKWRQKRAW